MNEATWIVSAWAEARRRELVLVPDTIDIHPDFLAGIDRKTFEDTFRGIWAMFDQIYVDIAKTPERFGMPLYASKDYHYGTKEAGESRSAPWWPIWLLMALFGNGRTSGDRMLVDMPGFRAMNKIRKPHILLEALTDYGFGFDGLKNSKLPPKLEALTITYPDNPAVLQVLELVAKKVLCTQQVQSGWNPFGNSFLLWHYRILADDLQTVHFGEGSEHVADQMRDAQDRAFVVAMDERLRAAGMACACGAINEGPQLNYHRSQAEKKRKAPCQYRIMSWLGHLVLMLRIRDAEACLAHVETCSGEIRAMFRHSDPGCEFRANGSCKFGVRYIYEGEMRWHCACCNPAFWLHPKEADIEDYIKLMELGGQKK